MVAADVTENPNTITETISQAIPVNSNSHHGPASRHRPVRSPSRRRLPAGG